MSEHGVDIVLKARDEASQKFSHIQQSFERLGGALLGFKGAQIAMGGIAVAGALVHEKIAEMRGDSIGMLEAELAVTAEFKTWAHMIPILGRGVTTLMDQFGNDAKLKGTIELLKTMRQETEAAKITAATWFSQAKLEGMKAAGVPESAIVSQTLANESDARLKDIDTKQKHVDELRKIFREQREIEQQSFKSENATRLSSVSLL